MKYLVICLAVILAIPFINAERFIVVDKKKCELVVIDEGDTLFNAPVCLGKSKGQKKRKNDNRTPEGDFEISMIQNSTHWLFNPGDGRPLVPHAYGPWFFRLKCPMTFHIGIHGTSKPSSVGKRQSMGCIRLRNSDVVRLRDMVFTGMKVHITSDSVN